ncbi:peptidase M24 [Vibrio cholerae]|nr:peptidase M24 [Vibrio cholerae]
MTLLDPSVPRVPSAAPDREVKTTRLRRILEEHPRAESLMLTSAESLSWYLDGARVAVPIGGAPVLGLRVDRTSETLYCLSNEAERMVAEELPAGMQIQLVPWSGELIPAADDGTLPEHLITADLRAARASLLPEELARYRELCADLAKMATDVLEQAGPRSPERAIAAAAAGRIVAMGGEPLVVLVAGESRRHYRHPLPTESPVGAEVTLVLCARRRGMIANLTRRVRFRGTTPEAASSEQRILEVEADILRATRVGRPFTQVFADVAAAYPAHGFAEDEWTRHHQGGPTGYLGRDPKLTPTTPGRFVEHQAFAWNPTAPGVKVEDTVLLTEVGLQVLTVDPRWPTLDVGGIDRPITLAR